MKKRISLSPGISLFYENLNLKDTLTDDYTTRETHRLQIDAFKQYVKGTVSPRFIESLTQSQQDLHHPARLDNRLDGLRTNDPYDVILANASTRDHWMGAVIRKLDDTYSLTLLNRGYRNGAARYLGLDRRGHYCAEEFIFADKQPIITLLSTEDAATSDVYQRLQHSCQQHFPLQLKKANQYRNNCGTKQFQAALEYALWSTQNDPRQCRTGNGKPGHRLPHLISSAYGFRYHNWPALKAMPEANPIPFRIFLADYIIAQNPAPTRQQLQAEKERYLKNKQFRACLIHQQRPFYDTLRSVFPDQSIKEALAELDLKSLQQLAKFPARKVKHLADPGLLRHLQNIESKPRLFPLFQTTFPHAANQITGRRIQHILKHVENLIGQKQFEAAIRITETHNEMTPHYLHFRNLSLAWLSLCNADNAVKALHAGLEAFPESGVLCNDLGTYYYDQNQIRDAITYFQVAVRNNPENPAYLNNLGCACYVAGDQEHLQQVHALTPEN